MEFQKKNTKNTRSLLTTTALSLALCIAANPGIPAVAAPIAGQSYVASNIATTTPAATKTVSTIKTTANLNLRKGAGTKFAKVAVLKKSTTVVKTGKAKGKWWQVKAGKRTGWVNSGFLKTTKTVVSDKKPAATKKPVTAGKTATYRWNTDKVNIRKGASVNRATLGMVPAWEKMQFLGKTQNGWSYVKSSKGNGWIKNTYLSKTENYPVAVYGTLRKGQSAYSILAGKTSKETKTKIVSHTLYLKPGSTWWTYIVPTSGKKNTVVVEKMVIKKAAYNDTIKRMDSWERFDPSAPLADQNYNRKLIKDLDGKTVYAYVAGKKIADYLKNDGSKITSGDYLKRF
ncbi:SH3 domain-containing protein [Paeniglutamicibacter sp. NPDC091659]|uniref:SH3 domain-containing protein n=1 Tax=Paeniglutamicibacter sp. NPDC091659 TaxID=3364389 RepID=UPI003826867A